MRTFGTFLVAAIFAGAAACGDSSGTSGTGTDGGPPASIDANTSGGGGYTSPTGRSPATGGMCPSSSTGQICTGEQAYMDCLIAACGTQAKTCFGNNYMKGDYTGGVCAQFLTCEMVCPCDDTGTLCMANCAAQYVYSSPDCTTCVTTLSACTQAAACQQPVCTTTGTPTSTATSTITAAGASCTALQACCASLPATVAPSCQSALSASGGVEAACTAVIQGFQSSGYCASTTSTTTSTTTATMTPTATATTTATATGANCSALQACCAAVPAAVAPSCQSSLSAAGGVETTCATLLQAFQTGGYCAAATSTSTSTATATTTSTSTATTTATGAGCASLQKCCASMSSTTATACQSAYTSAAGVDSSCTLVLQQFQAAGLCK